MKKYPVFFWSACILLSIFGCIEFALYNESIMQILKQTAIYQLFQEQGPEGMLFP